LQGFFANSSDYVRDLIRRDRARLEAIAEIQAAVETASLVVPPNRLTGRRSRAGCAHNVPGSNSWVLRPAAEADLSGTWLEGASKWDFERVEHNVDGLFALFDPLVEFPEIACERDEFSPFVRIHPSGPHLVIYRQERQGLGIDIVRILHAHQNLTAYLSDR
jgi:toxin ParE1/3/4